jgi:hypothetical protein
MYVSAVEPIKPNLALEGLSLTTSVEMQPACMAGNAMDLCEGL